MFLAMDAREPDMCRVAGRLCRALTDGDARSLGVLTRSFPPGLLAPSPPDQVIVVLSEGAVCEVCHVCVCVMLVTSDRRSELARLLFPGCAASCLSVSFSTSVARRSGERPCRLLMRWSFMPGGAS